MNRFAKKKKIPREFEFRYFSNQGRYKVFKFQTQGELRISETLKISSTFLVVLANLFKVSCY